MKRSLFLTAGVRIPLRIEGADLVLCLRAGLQILVTTDLRAIGIYPALGLAQRAGRGGFEGGAPARHARPRVVVVGCAAVLPARDILRVVV